MYVKKYKISKIHVYMCKKMCNKIYMCNKIFKIIFNNSYDI